MKKKSVRLRGAIKKGASAWVGVRQVACPALALALALMGSAGCDSSALASGGSGGQGANAGSAGAGGQGGSAGSGGAPQLVQIDPTHYRLIGVTLAAGAGGGGGTSGGGSSGSGASGAGGSAPLLTCTPTVQSGTPPTVAVCGDGFRTGAEACDDGDLLSGDTCSPTCQVTPRLVAPHPLAMNSLPLPGRELGSSRHPVAAGCNTVGVAYLDRSTQPPSLTRVSPLCGDVRGRLSAVS